MADCKHYPLLFIRHKYGLIDNGQIGSYKNIPLIIYLIGI